MFPLGLADRMVVELLFMALCLPPLRPLYPLFLRSGSSGSSGSGGSGGSSSKDVGKGENGKGKDKEEGNRKGKGNGGDSSSSSSSSSLSVVASLSCDIWNRFIASLSCEEEPEGAAVGMFRIWFMRYMLAMGLEKVRCVWGGVWYGVWGGVYSDSTEVCLYVCLCGERHIDTNPLPLLALSNWSLYPSHSLCKLSL
jgi:hypothetical protein